MEVKAIDLSHVSTLEEFYTVLEHHALRLAKEHDITDLLLNFKSRTTTDKEIQKLQWEVEAFLHSFHGKRVFSFSTSNGKEIGEVAEYPTLDAHQMEAFEYIKLRANTSASSILKARYNHLLWASITKKNRNFAEQAAKAYIEAVKDCVSLNRTPEHEWSFFIAQLFENLIGLVSECKIFVEQVKKLSNELLFASPTVNFWAKHGIIDDMLKHPNIFKSNDFIGTLALYEEHIQHLKAKTDDFLLVNYHIPTALKVAQKLKSDVREWYDEKGKAYLRMAESEADESRNWIKLDHYRSAIDAFRLSGNKTKKKEVEQRYFAL